MNDRFPALCRGKLKPQPSKLKCYLDSKHGYFPTKVEVISVTPSINLYHQVVGPQRRRRLIEIAKDKLFRAPVALSNGGRAVTDTRIARIANIEGIDDPAIK